MWRSCSDKPAHYAGAGEGCWSGVSMPRRIMSAIAGTLNALHATPHPQHPQTSQSTTLPDPFGRSLALSGAAVDMHQTQAYRARRSGVYPCCSCSSNPTRIRTSWHQREWWPAPMSPIPAACAAAAANAANVANAYGERAGMRGNRCGMRRRLGLPGATNGRLMMGSAAWVSVFATYPAWPAIAERLLPTLAHPASCA
jgi:hypothetical protein